MLQNYVQYIYQGFFHHKNEVQRYISKYSFASSKVGNAFQLSCIELWKLLIRFLRTYTRVETCSRTRENELMKQARSLNLFFFSEYFMPKIIYVYIQNFVWEKSEVKLIGNEFQKKKKKKTKKTLWLITRNYPIDLQYVKFSTKVVINSAWSRKCDWFVITGETMSEWIRNESPLTSFLFPEKKKRKKKWIDANEKVKMKEEE